MKISIKYQGADVMKQEVTNIKMTSLLNCVPRVLKTCSRANVSCLPTCLACLRTSVLRGLRALRANWQYQQVFFLSKINLLLCLAVG